MKHEESEIEMNARRLARKRAAQIYDDVDDEVQILTITTSKS